MDRWLISRVLLSLCLCRLLSWLPGKHRSGQGPGTCTIIKSDPQLAAPRRASPASWSLMPKLLWGQAMEPGVQLLAKKERKAMDLCCPLFVFPLPQCTSFCLF